MNDITDLSENERPARYARAEVRNWQVDDSEALGWYVRLAAEAHFEKQGGNG